MLHLSGSMLESDVASRVGPQSLGYHSLLYVINTRQRIMMKIVLRPRATTSLMGESIATALLCKLILVFNFLLISHFPY